MSDLISREDSINAIYHHFPSMTMGECANVLHEVPSAEVTLCHLESPCEYQNADIAIPSAQQWIPATEGLPEEGVQVLVTDDAGGLATIDVDCGYFDKEYGRFEWFHSQNVTAWMPLPEPWRGEE